MNVKEMHPEELPTSDLPEIAHRLHAVKDGLEEVDDDFTRQEIYDRISMSAVVIGDVVKDILAIELVMRAVVDA